MLPVFSICIALLFCGQMVLGISFNLSNNVTIEISDIDGEPEEEKDDTKEEEKFRDWNHFHTLLQSSDMDGLEIGRMSLSLHKDHDPDHHTPPPEVV